MHWSVQGTDSHLRGAAKLVESALNCLERNGSAIQGLVEQGAGLMAQEKHLEDLIFGDVRSMPVLTRPRRVNLLSLQFQLYCPIKKVE